MSGVSKLDANDTASRNKQTAFSYAFARHGPKFMAVLAITALSWYHEYSLWTVSGGCLIYLVLHVISFKIWGHCCVWVCGVRNRINQAQHPSPSATLKVLSYNAWLRPHGIFDQQGGTSDTKKERNGGVHAV
jgi:hypothetical protein